MVFEKEVCYQCTYDYFILEEQSSFATKRQTLQLEKEF